MVMAPLLLDMAQSKSANREYSAQELREAGASELFISYYQIAPSTASARSEVENSLFDLSDLNERPSRGGGFFEALWSGDEVQAIRRADTNNEEILKEVTGKTREDTFA